MSLPKNISGDLHVHPSLKPYNSQDEPEGIWKKRPASNAINKLSKQIRDAISSLARGSQVHLEACAQSNSRLLFASVYPIERPFLKVVRKRPFKVLLRLILSKKKEALLGEAATGIPSKEIARMINEVDSDSGVNYFKDFQKEVNFLLNAQKTVSNDPKFAEYRFHMASDYSDLKTLLNDPKNIVAVLSVEGAHAFGDYVFKSPFNTRFEDLSSSRQTTLENSFLQNIQEVKSNATAGAIPLFVTFSHHFNNLLAGHATSLSDRSKLLKAIRQFWAPGMRHLFDQEVFLEEGFSSLGKKVLEALLSRDNGRRILIDTKHMSPRARSEFYDILENDYRSEELPIIHSHGAVNGIKTLKESAKNSSCYVLDKNSFVSRWGINLTDEDIEKTFKSKGLIGVLLHEGRVPGQLFKDEKKKLHKNDVQGLEDLYQKLLWTNILHIVRVQKDHITSHHIDRDPWEGLAIGSDYDGIVDPFDDYEGIKDYNKLREEMIRYIEQEKEILNAVTNEPLALSEVKNLFGQKSAKNCIEQLFIGNMDTFLSNYFTTTYLENHN